jgi:hypothetical protein
MTDPTTAASGRRTRALPWAGGALAAAAAVAVLLTGQDAVSAPDPGTDPAQDVQLRVLAPKDGALVVGKTKVAQQVGYCDGSACYHQPPVEPVTVQAGTADRVGLQAGTSTDFTVLYAHDAHGTQVNIPVIDGELDLADLPAGAYTLTVAGDDLRSMWQFVLQVD